MTLATASSSRNSVGPNPRNDILKVARQYVARYTSSDTRK
jgi:hypothetical protein